MLFNPVGSDYCQFILQLYCMLINYFMPVGTIMLYTVVASYILYAVTAMYFTYSCFNLYCHIYYRQLLILLILYACIYGHWYLLTYMLYSVCFYLCTLCNILTGMTTTTAPFITALELIITHTIQPQEDITQLHYITPFLV